MMHSITIAVWAAMIGDEGKEEENSKLLRLIMRRIEVGRVGREAWARGDGFHHHIHAHTHTQTQHRAREVPAPAEETGARVGVLLAIAIRMEVGEGAILAVIIIIPALVVVRDGHRLLFL